MIGNERNVGLDLYRFLAIALVLVSHSRHLFSWKDIEGWSWWWLSVGGYLGVELFFVLSGFLIGTILIRKVFFSEHSVWKGLATFWIRRWFRTLPLYYLVLIATFVHGLYLDQAQNASWLYLVFLQNFDRQALTFFPVSWSLSVEEWFYLLVPVAMAAISMAGRNRRNLLLSILGVIACIILIRIHIVHAHPELTWGDMRKNVFLRFDSLLAGVLWAYISIYRQDLYRLVSSPVAMLLALSALGALIAWYYFHGETGLDTDFFSKSILLSLTSFVLLPTLGYCTVHVKRRFKIITYGSLLSYGVYLIHLQILGHLIPPARASASLLFALGAWLAFLALTFALAYLLYRFYESPMMRLRDRFS